MAEAVLDMISRVVGEGPIIRRVRDAIRKVRERIGGGTRGSILRR
jgi:hypothetical protein